MPHDARPRYVVGTVTGWSIAPWFGGESSGPAFTFAYVQDRAYGYRTVAEFRRAKPVQRAERLAEKLNREEEAWLTSMTGSG